MKVSDRFQALVALLPSIHCIGVGRHQSLSGLGGEERKHCPGNLTQTVQPTVSRYQSIRACM